MSWCRQIEMRFGVLIRSITYTLLFWTIGNRRWPHYDSNWTCLGCYRIMNDLSDGDVYWDRASVDMSFVAIGLVCEEKCRSISWSDDNCGYIRAKHRNIHTMITQFDTHLGMTKEVLTFRVYRTSLEVCAPDRETSWPMLLIMVVTAEATNVYIHWTNSWIWSRLNII